MALLLEKQENNEIKEIRIVPGAIFNKFERLTEIENYLKNKKLNAQEIARSKKIF